MNPHHGTSQRLSRQFHCAIGPITNRGHHAIATQTNIGSATGSKLIVWLRLGAAEQYIDTSTALAQHHSQSVHEIV